MTYLAAILVALSVGLPGTAPGGSPPADLRPIPMSEPWAEFEPRDRFEAGLPDGWYARIETSGGSILALLHPDQAPQSVAHFAALAEGRLPWTDVVTGEVRRGHYYDGLLVHRAEAGSRLEAGDPHGTGRGGPDLYVPFVRGAMDFSQAWRIGNTRAPLGRISGAMFFITVSPDPRLSNRHPCFGTVLKGKEVVFRITSVETYSNGRPVEPVRIERIRIRKKGSPDALPEPEQYAPEVREFGLREDSPPPSRGER